MGLCLKWCAAYVITAADLLAEEFDPISQICYGYD